MTWSKPLIMLLIVTVLGGACATTVDVGNGVRRQGDNIFIYEGPEIEAVVGTYQADRALGENWLVLTIQLRATPGVGVVTVERSAISARTPDGRFLELLSQDDFRASYGEIRSRARRAELSAPTKDPWDRGISRCDRWLFAAPTDGFATDELHLDSFEYCWGPLIFRVPRGIQPGRWHLVVELEESTADIPFEVEVQN